MSLTPTDELVARIRHGNECLVEGEVIDINVDARLTRRATINTRDGTDHAPFSGVHLYFAADQYEREDEET